MNGKILIVDDDDHIREVVRFALEKAGFDVHEARDGAEGLAMAKTHSPDLLILDVMMPEMDGTDVCRELRKTSNVPILFLSSRDEEIDRVLGLELGADDYVTKPFSPRELVARVKAILRRRGPESEDPTEDEKTHGLLCVNTSSLTTTWNGTVVELTKTEFDILCVLIRSPGKVYRRSELMSGTIVSDRTVDSHVGHLRKKFAAIGATLIETAHGSGYRLGNCE